MRLTGALKAIYRDPKAFQYDLEKKRSFFLLIEPGLIDNMFFIVSGTALVSVF